MAQHTNPGDLALLEVDTQVCSQVPPSSSFLTDFRSQRMTLPFSRIGPQQADENRYRSAYTALLTSSVLNYRHENGRRYHPIAMEVRMQ